MWWVVTKSRIYRDMRMANCGTNETWRLFLFNAKNATSYGQCLFFGPKKANPAWSPLGWMGVSYCSWFEPIRSLLLSPRGRPSNKASEAGPTTTFAHIFLFLRGCHNLSCMITGIVSDVIWVFVRYVGDNGYWNIGYNIYMGTDIWVIMKYLCILSHNRWQIIVNILKTIIFSIFFCVYFVNIK